MPLSSGVGREVYLVKRKDSVRRRFTFHVSRKRWEGTGSRVNHEPEDLPGELTDVPSWAGELARMSCGCNPQGLPRP